MNEAFPPSGASLDSVVGATRDPGLQRCPGHPKIAGGLRYGIPRHLDCSGAVLVIAKKGPHVSEYIHRSGFAPHFRLLVS
jgi:hypothetical protein